MSNSMENGCHKFCAYCKKIIADDDYLQCMDCRGNVHIKCLRRASTPGDLLGDVFFDFTCANCVGPSTSSATKSEKFERQHLPWLLVITLALYNLSIKAKGLSHHGYFHWRTHIISFIDKNWDYLFEPGTRRRKNWIGSISGALSHNSPEFFLSGQEVFNEAGWWKLAYAKQTPKFIYKMYEQLSQKRQLMRQEKRPADKAQHKNIDNNNLVESYKPLAKKQRQLSNSDTEDLLPIQETCSRMLPYMGRKPKLPAKQEDSQVDKQLPTPPPVQQQPMNSVQSNLMDFLAESLSNDDLSMFNNLANIAVEPLVDNRTPGVNNGVDERDDFLAPLITGAEHGVDVNLFDGMHDIKIDSIGHEANGAAFFGNQTEWPPDGELPRYGSEDDSYLQSPSEHSIEDEAGVGGEEDDDDDEYQPRIVQVTNFQQLDGEKTQRPQNEQTDKLHTDLQPAQNQLEHDKEIKKELKSDAEETETEADTIAPGAASALAACLPSLFKKTPRRNWPWLVQTAEKFVEAAEQEPPTDSSLAKNESLVMMSVYEEKELLQKLRKIFSLEQECQLQIPAYVRRFYRKLTIRAWKREHNRPVFNLDDELDANRRKNKRLNKADDEAHILDRYQLIAQSAGDARRSFLARIVGSTQHELFESPYTQRILHPFIYRNKDAIPPWLKLMCELKYTVNGEVPSRATIDYCYVRPHHIAAVNALLQAAFWPGIDMSECLSYPDYTVVAMYKKLVIGCGFLVPDAGFNEAYISFMAVRPGWQRSGIATFMLYHLIQTCMSKDITLHVSATNPAVVLYQKFGFKIEEVCLNFYEKYLPIDSPHSRHALFLRLSR